MKTRKKAIDLIPLIMEAKTREDAIETLNEVLVALHLSESFTEMVALRDALKIYQTKFKSATEKLKTSSTYEELHECRISLNFLYRDIQDDLSSKVNFNKIFYEESKTTRRADGIKELIGSEEANELKAKSASALRDIVGASETYKSFTTEYSMAYACYKELEMLLNSIRMFIDAIASKEKRELLILQKDVK